MVGVGTACSRPMVDMVVVAVAVETALDCLIVKVELVAAVKEGMLLQQLLIFLPKLLTHL